jgi:acyl carrier protein
MSVEKSPREALAWVAEVFETSLEKIRLETKKDEIEAWDSLGILTLMARLDEDFHILLTEEEIQQLRSVQDILNLLRKREMLRED